MRTESTGAKAETSEAAENSRAGHEYPPAPDEIGEQSSGQQQSGVNQVVATDDPLERADSGGEMLADRSRRQIDDGRVDLRHQHGGAENRQREAVARRPAGGERRKIARVMAHCNTSAVCLSVGGSIEAFTLSVRSCPQNNPAARRMFRRRSKRRVFGMS
jgi:hypothetical protein